jgi:MFS family permease
MVIANVAALVLEPTFGFISDRTRSRYGRRMPYILIGIPISAMAFAFLPSMPSMSSFLIVLIIFCVVMACWRTPVVSLMPDLTPGPLRSQANGIVNMLGGMGSLIAFGVGGLLLNAGGFPLPFLTAAFIMLVAVVVLYFKVHEPPHAFEPKVKEEKVPMAPGERKSLLLILCAIFFWFIGYNAVETYFTLYATKTLKIPGGTATMMLGLYAVAFLAFAVPAGFIGAKIGRRKTILIGLAGVTILFFPMIIGTNMVVTICCLLGGGLFWACVNINSLPMVLRLAGERRIGTFTGYYYLFSVTAAVLGPPAAGALIDQAGKHSLFFIPVAGNYRILFLFACLSFLAAFVVLFFVRHGEDTKGEPLTTNTDKSNDDSVAADEDDSPRSIDGVADPDDDVHEDLEDANEDLVDLTDDIDTSIDDTVASV